MVVEPCSMGATVQPWPRAIASAAGLVLLAAGVATGAALLTPLDGATGDEATAEPEDDLGFSLLTNGHHHRDTDLQPLTAAEQAELDEQLAATRAVAERYPTVADAESAGYRRSGPYSPGLGAHYVRTNAEALNPDGDLDDADLASPLAILYDGTDPGSEVVGFMYYSTAAEEPEGFAGSNDVWHRHTNICIVQRPDGSLDAPLGADRSSTAEECALFGGSLMPETQWMVHVWSVPGYELGGDGGGVFAEVHPAIRCADGTYYQRPIEEWPDSPLSTCREL